MCINPHSVIIPSRYAGKDRRAGLERLVACRKCWQCKADRVKDWAGRCIAEKEYSTATSFVTLTYGKTLGYYEKFDDLGALTLIYRDVQLWLKRIRKAGYQVRYLVSGEYGKLKGRAHWHACLFWTGTTPLSTFDEEGKPLIEIDGDGICWKDPFWPHGFTHWKGEVNIKSAQYVCKYMLKDQDGERENEFHMSKLPVLGGKFMRDWALKHVEQGLPLHSGEYRFPEIRKKNGKPFRFVAQGAAAREMANAYCLYWNKIHGGHWPHSDFVMAYLDSRAQRMDVPLTEALLKERSTVRRPQGPPDGGPVFLHERRNQYYSVTADGAVLFWSFDREGNRAWVEDPDIVTPTQAAKLRAASDQAKSPDAYREASQTPIALARRSTR